MRVYPAPAMPSEIEAVMRQRFDAGVPQAQLISEMRSSGLHIIQCIQLISRFYEISRNQAKEIVHFSDAWADMRQTHDAFHETAWEAAKQSGYVESEVPPHAQPKTHSAA